MKVSIATFCQGHNYGALLQAWALGRFVRGLGHDVNYIKYCHPWSFGGPFFAFRSWIGKTPQATLSKWCENIRSINLRRYFKPMEDGFAFTPIDYGMDANRLVSSPPIADCYITGSDQVWTGFWRYCAPYFLDFGDPSVRRIAYAPSMGGMGLCPDEDKKINAIKRFHSISVREPEDAEWLRKRGVDDVCVVPDPTLLLCAGDYKELVENGRRLNPSVFAYMLGNVSNERSDEIAKMTDDESLSVPLHGFKIRQGKNCLLTVPDFLTNLSCAKFVITNSFHATVFSVLFHRPFAYLKFIGVDDHKNTRVMNLLNRIGLEHLAYEHIMPQCRDVEIDWRSVDEKLAVFRKGGIDFLRDALYGTH